MLGSPRARSRGSQVSLAVLSVVACHGPALQDAGGRLETDPTSIAYGNFAVGTQQQNTVQLKNIGLGKVVVSGIALEPPDASVTLSQVLTQNCDTTLRADATKMVLLGDTCATFTVTYAPHSETVLNSGIVITSNDPTNPKLSIPLTGQGVAGTIRVCLVDATTGMVDSSTCYPGAASTAPSIAFGAWPVGQTVVRSVQVFNDGMYPLAINDARIEASVADFSIVGGLAVSPIVVAGDSIALQVQFKPQVNSMETGSLVIPSNDVTTPVVTVPLTATSLGPALCITPTAMDFGTVPKGTTRTLQLTLQNCGEADYSLSTLALNNNGSGSTVFTTPPAGTANANPIPALPYAFPTGATLTIDVLYSPVYVEQAPAPEDTGYISLTTEYEQVTVPVEGRGGFPGCTATGMSLTPTAVIGVDSHGAPVDPSTMTFDPLTNVTLDGSGSTAPSPETVTSYSWRIASQPDGSVASVLPNTTDAQVTLFMELVGDYVIELVVSTSDGCQSAPVDTTLHVLSHAAIHVQLTWPQSYGDLDLHYIGPGGSFYETSPYIGDLDWQNSLATAYGPVPPMPTGNLSPDWGGPGTYPNGGDTVAPDGSPLDDASLDCDQRDGYGPENATHDKPFDGTYTVEVHYYCAANELLGGSPYGPATAIVSIFVNGTLAWHGTMPNMQEEQVWDVASIVVADNGESIVVNTLSTPLYSVSEGCHSTGSSPGGG